MTLKVDTLDSMCELIADCPHSTPKWTKTGIVVLRNQYIKNGKLDLSNPSYTDEENYLFRSRRAELRKGDIVITREAPMGEVCMIPDGLKCCLGQRQVLLRPKKNVSGDYLLYALQSPYVQHQISWSEGTGTTVSNLRIPSLKSLKIPRLGGDEKKIAEIIKSINDKLECNLELNQVLEEIATLLFKSWFVDFEPVYAKKNALEAGLTKAQAERAAMAVIAGFCTLSEYEENTAEIEKKLEECLASIGKVKAEDLKSIASLFSSEFEDSKLGAIPKGWGVNTLSDVIQFNPTLSLKKNTVAKYIDMKSVPNSGHRINEVVSRPFASGTKFQNGDVLMARITPCLENGKTAYVDCLSEDEVAWGSTEFIVMRPKSIVPDKWIYLLSRYPEFVAFAVTNMSGTSGRQRVSADVLGSYKIALPQGEHIFNAINKILEPVFEKIKLNSLENTKLAQLRDLLLPKLLSGEINLDNVQIESEAQ